MATKNKAAYAKSRRKIHHQDHKFGQFTVEYLKCKHLDIYGEILQMYNEINIRNPSKRKLHKTAEFEVWKKTVEMEITTTQNVSTAVETAENVTDSVTVTPNVSVLAETVENVTASVAVTPNVSVLAETVENVTASVAVTPNVSALAEMDENVAVSVTATPNVPETETATTEIMETDLELGAMNTIGDPWLVDDEIQKLVQELRDDPDLRSIYDHG